jgi:quercetin dioxygenase-like cupin family protein
MVSAGETITSGRGDRITFRATAADTAGELLELEVLYRPGAALPPLHQHPFQEEHFAVLEGSLWTRVGDEERVYRAGERFRVPPATPHAMVNAGDVDARIAWEIRPALATEELFASMWRLARDGKTGATGAPNVLQLALLLRAHEREFRLVRPQHALMRLLFAVLAPLARALGYRERYEG